MNRNVEKLLKEKLWYVGTRGEKNAHVIPIAYKDVNEKGQLIFGNVFLKHTLNHVKEYGKASVAVCDEATGESYLVKGDAAYIEEGADVETLRDQAEKSEHDRTIIKGAVVITPVKIINMAPGEDNNKVIE